MKRATVSAMAALAAFALVAACSGNDARNTQPTASLPATVHAATTAPSTAPATTAAVTTVAPTTTLPVPEAVCPGRVGPYILTCCRS